MSVQTIVGINTWVAHRNTHVFGEDAEQFCPERWLIDDNDKLSIMNRYYLPVRLHFYLLNPSRRYLTCVRIVVWPGLADMYWPSCVHA